MSSRMKRAAFWAMTLLLPLFLLTCVELLLRVTGLFAPEPLFLEVPESQGTALKVNPWVGRRYFDSTRTILPAIKPELFTREKAPGAFRILCIGESSTAGFPFEGPVPFPVQLRELLARAHPARRIEVLNAGISAISSYVVLDLLPEFLREAKPDLVIAYLGHNEFYGVYGSASTLFPGETRGFVTAVLRLQHLHLVQAVKAALQTLSPRPGTGPEDRTLMQAVVGDQDIALGSSRYRATLEAFRENLETMAELCRDHHVPMMIGTLLCNERDQPPFHSLAPPAEKSAGLHAALASGDTLLRAGELQKAEGRYRDALQADSNNADAWFGLGRLRLAAGDSAGALPWFLGARDRDAMRFRAPGEANEIIRDVAGEQGIPCVDLLGTFRRASRGGILGGDLFCDHLHPTPQGYYLMAEAFFRQIGASGILPPPDLGFRLPGAPLGVTDLDWEIGQVKVFPMIHDWPFRKVRVTRADYRPHGDSAATRIAVAYLSQKHAWTRAHENMAQVYLQRGEYELARREYEAAAVSEPDDPWPHHQIALLYETLKDWPRRSAALREALVRSPAKGLLAYHLAMSEYRQAHLDDAARMMDFAAGAPELNPAERQNARYYLAGFLFEAGRKDRAREVLRVILRDDPGYMAARQFLSKLERTP